MRHVTGMSLSRKQLGRILRAARERQGLSLPEVAVALDTSWSTVQRLESGGSARLDRPRLSALLDALRITDADQREEIQQLAAEAREPVWWYPYTSALRRTFSLYLAYEADAVGIRTLATVIIPGLLQTEAYARAVMHRLDPETVDARVRVRLERQARLRTADGPPLTAILDEACLFRMIGSPELHHAQLLHLVEVAALPTVSLRVMPFSAGAYPETIGEFVLLDLPDGDTAACIELAAGDLFPEAEIYADLFGELEESAYSAQDSVTIIKSMAKGMQR